MMMRRRVDQTRPLSPERLPGHLSGSQPQPNPGPYERYLENFILLSNQPNRTKLALSKILPYALGLSRADMGALLVLQNVDGGPVQRLSLIAQHRMPQDVVKALLQGNFNQQLQLDQPTQRPPLIPLTLMQSMLTSGRLSGLIGLPLVCQGRSLGVIILGTESRHRQALSRKAQHHLAVFSQLVAGFLERLRLHTENQRLQKRRAEPAATTTITPLSVDTASVGDLERLLEAVMSAEEEVIKYNTDLDTLNQFSSELAGTLSLQKILEKAVDQVRTSLQADMGWIYLQDNDELRLYAHQGLSENYIEVLNQLRPGSGVEGMAFSRNETIVRDTTLFHSGLQRHTVTAEGIGIVAAAPLTAGNKPFGVLCIANRNPNHNWDSRDEYMLSSIALRVAQAIFNARLFSNLQTKAADLETQNHQLQQNAIQLAGDFDVLKQQITEILKFQEQVWLTLPSSDDPRELVKQRNEVMQSSQDVITMIKRALQAISQR